MKTITELAELAELAELMDLDITAFMGIAALNICVLLH